MTRNTFFSLLLLVMTMFTTACAENKNTDTFKTKSGKEVVITPIKHASMQIQYDGLEIEVDPVISLDPKTDYTKFPKADIILVTHEHYDHCDKEAVRELSKQSTIVIANPNSAKILGKGEVMDRSATEGDAYSNIVSLKNGDTKSLIKGITIDAVPAYNTSKEKQKFHPKGRDNGYILTIDGLRIYIAGDTEDIPEMGNIKDIDVAYLPCNLPYTMSPEQVAKAAKVIKPKVLFPYHYSQTKIEKVSELLNGSGIDVRIRNYQ